jgi:ubiquitin conjugation factor E4 B
MNDTTYLLDEGLSKLAEIHDIEVEMDDKAAWAAQTPQYRQEREGVLSTAQRQASSYIALGNETVNMLSYLTVEIKEPFLTAEIVDRLATMMNYNLVILVGEKMSNLKVLFGSRGWCQAVNVVLFIALRLTMSTRSSMLRQDSFILTICRVNA